MNRALLRRLLLGAMLCTFAVLKLYYDPPRGRIDGFYYMHLAQQLADGDGFTSRISLYLQGFKFFPHPVNQSPGWIVALAGASLLVGMEKAARHLPELLYAVDLLLVYLLANRLRRRMPGGGSGWLRADGLPDFGHVAVFLLGANAVFFRFTSVPYTEAQAFGLLMGALLALDRAALERSLAWAAGSGALAGLALLTRTQMLPAMIAIPGVLALVGLRDRRYLGMAAAFAGASLVPWIPWTAWLSTWLDPLTPTTVLGLAALHETEHLRHFQHAVVTNSAWEYIVDRASGLLVAFHPTSKYSYTSRFGPVIWVVVIAPLWFALRGLPGARSWIRGPAAERVLPWAMLACAVGMLIPVHLLHGAFFKPWLFAHRHGLPLLFAILPCMAWLDASGRASRVIGTALLAGSVAFMSFRLDDAMSTRVRDYPKSEYRLGEWLDSHSTHPIVLTTRAQRMSAHSRRAYFHWIACDEPPRQTLRMLRARMADYLIILKRDKKCSFVDFDIRQLHLVHEFGQDKTEIRVYEVRHL